MVFFPLCVLQLYSRNMEDKTYILIAKYLEGTCNSEDIEMLQEWYNQSDENRMEFIRLKKAWIASDKRQVEQIESTRVSIWNKISTDIDVPLSDSLRKASKSKPYIYSSVAACAAILLTLFVQYISGFDLNRQEAQRTTLYMPKGERGQVLLPDGSHVWVNGGSKISYSSDFNEKNRRVILKGQAYFEVLPSDHQFVVEADGVDVVVYGTSFDVMAYEENPQINITLKEGLVGLFRSDTGEGLLKLAPNQRVTVDKQNYTYEKTVVEPKNYLTWTFDELVFEYTSVEEMYRMIENWYGVNISIASLPSKDVKYRYKIKSESLTEMLELINKITPISYKIEGKEVNIRYK